MLKTIICSALLPMMRISVFAPMRVLIAYSSTLDENLRPLLHLSFLVSAMLLLSHSVDYLSRRVSSLLPLRYSFCTSS